jgi:hypothetical protein
MGIIAGIALSVMGVMDFLRHRSGGTTAAALLVIEAVAIVVALGALFSWAWLREKRQILRASWRLSRTRHGGSVQRLLRDG